MVEDYSSFNENKTVQNNLASMWNTYMGIVLGLDDISSETGEMLPSYIDPKAIQEMNSLSTPLGGVNIAYISTNEDKIKKNAEKLLDGIKSAIKDGKITEERYFKTGVLNKMKTILHKNVLGLDK